MTDKVQAGGTPSKGTPKDKRLKENKPKVTSNAGTKQPGAGKVTRGF
jgi:hypothetical protein